MASPVRWKSRRLAPSPGGLTAALSRMANVYRSPCGLTMGRGQARKRPGEGEPQRTRPSNGAAAGWLIIMVKAPVMGRVKTRLARDIGTVAATAFARHAARNLIARLGRDKRWRTALAIAPDTALAARLWPAGLPRLPQGRGDLGLRMARLLRGPVPAGRPVLLIGADIPGISPDHIARAFRILARNDVAFAPADDGGYWLIGLNRGGHAAGLFRDVRWSTRFALADTLANCAGRRTGFAARLADVDEAHSYRLWGRLAGRLVLPAQIAFATSRQSA